jgi:hypothetical protein
MNARAWSTIASMVAMSSMSTGVLPASIAAAFAALMRLVRPADRVSAALLVRVVARIDHRDVRGAALEEDGVRDRAGVLAASLSSTRGFGFSQESNQAARGHSSIVVCRSDAESAGMARYSAIERPG